MLLYKKLDVPNFEAMRLELATATLPKVMLGTRFWDEAPSWFETNTPTLYNFIERNKKLSIRLFRFYLTPPNDILIPHVDGLTTNRSPLGLNIPITGYQNTTMDWYDNPADNFKDGNYGFNNITASRIIDFNKLTKIESTVIDCPTFVRTDVVHGVVNNNPTPRLVLSIRFVYSKVAGQQFNEVFNF